MNNDPNPEQESTPYILTELRADDLHAIIVTSDEDRNRVKSLLDERYQWRGYGEVALPKPDCGHLIILVERKEVAVGTLTVKVDGYDGLGCEELFGNDVEKLRKKFTVCEFGRLAVLPDQTPAVIAKLFNAGYLVLDKVAKPDVAVMEVNPRHVAFYKRMVKAWVVGEEKIKISVGAPAVLLAVSLADIRAQIELNGKSSLCKIAYACNREELMLSSIL